jgi:rRNA maturation RNase YbeY
LTTLADADGSTLDVSVDLEHESLDVDRESLRRLITGVLVGEGVVSAQVGIVLADREKVLELNRRFLNHDYPTDVLSFSYSADVDRGVIEGEVYVDLDTAAERCLEFGVSFANEVSRYAIHGVLHLVGHTDDTKAERRAMREREDSYLRTD